MAVKDKSTNEPLKSSEEFAKIVDFAIPNLDDAIARIDDIFDDDETIYEYEDNSDIILNAEDDEDDDEDVDYSSTDNDEKKSRKTKKSKTSKSSKEKGTKQKIDIVEKEIEQRASEMLSDSTLDLDTVGCKSDNLIFCRVLQAKIGKTASARPEIIGYAFQSTEDIYVPVMCLTAESVDKFDVDTKNKSKRFIRAGVVFFLNIPETVVLLSLPEFGCTATGGDLKVKLVMRSSKTSSTGNTYNLNKLPTSKPNTSIKSNASNCIGVNSSGDQFVLESYEKTFGDFLRARISKNSKKSSATSSSRASKAKRLALGEKALKDFS